MLAGMRAAARRKARVLWGLSAALLLAAPQAQAYLDPGTGSIILQGLIAALVAGLFYVRTAWTRIKSLFRRKPGPEDEPKNP